MAMSSLLILDSSRRSQGRSKRQFVVCCASYVNSDACHFFLLCRSHAVEPSRYKVLDKHGAQSPHRCERIDPFPLSRIIVCDATKYRYSVYSSRTISRMILPNQSTSVKSQNNHSRKYLEESILGGYGLA
jgi:hypothetical protein